MATESDKVNRSVLPIPDRPHVGLTTYDAKDPDTKYPPIRDLRPPAGAPNVLIILIDDAGFGAIQRLWWSLPDTELRETRGQWPAVQPLSHDRAVLADTPSLLTGRNHHSVNMGGITEIATSAPGYNSSCRTTARRLPRH